MRNGNLELSKRYQLDPFVLILPMRNGNFTNTLINVGPHACSYPTYEEWKLLIKLLLLKKMKRSYPTYEEWKLVDNPADIAGAVC